MTRAGWSKAEDSSLGNPNNAWRDAYNPQNTLSSHCTTSENHELQTSKQTEGNIGTGQSDEELNAVNPESNIYVQHDIDVHSEHLGLDDFDIESQQPSPPTHPGW